MFGIFEKKVTTEAELRDIVAKGIQLNNKKITNCKRDIERNIKEVERLGRMNTQLKEDIKNLIAENAKLATHNSTQEK